MVGAVRLGERRLARAARGGDHRRAQDLADLDGRHADAAGCGVDQQRMAALHVERLGPGQRTGRGRIGDGELDCLDEAHVARLGKTLTSCATTSSASPPQSSTATTSSPTLTLVQAGSTSVTMPDASVPGAKGKGGRRWYLPAMIRVVAKLTPAALMRMRTWPGLRAAARRLRAASLQGRPIGGRSSPACLSST